MFFSSLTIMSWLPLGKNLNCPSQPPTPDTHNKQTHSRTLCNIRMSQTLNWKKLLVTVFSCNSMEK